MEMINGRRESILETADDQADLHSAVESSSSVGIVNGVVNETVGDSHSNTRKPRKSRRHSVVSRELELLNKPGQQQEKGSQEKGVSRRPSGKPAGVQDPSLPSQASQKLAESNKLEDQINLQHLVELMRIFHEADENGSDGLDIDEFRAAFGQILGKGKNDQQMAIMFMKIDTNCDGTVDWDEFCTYMLLEYQEKDMMAGENLAPFPYPLKVLHSPHREMVSRITFLPSLSRRGHENTGPELERGDVEGRLVSACKDGSICFWKSNFTLQRMVTAESSSRLTWVTDLVVMPNTNRMVLSFTDNVVSLYDLSTATYERQLQIVAFSHCVLTMDYWFDPKDYNRAVLVLGDSGGGICIMEFHNALSSLFGVQTCGKPEDNLRIPFPELQYHTPEGMKVTYLPRLHADWVCQVKYCPSMEYTMSCSHDSSSSLCLMDLHCRKEGALFKVRKGISAFDYSKEWNIIATGGLDRSVRFWNPYVTGKPIAVLKGHTTAILHIAINCSDGQVLSFSKDMELRVWDIRDQLCLQSCHRFQQLEPQPPSAFYLHPPSRTLLIGTNQLGVLKMSREDGQHSGRGEVVSHEKPLCTALYNDNFNQVVSGCHGSVVSVWDVDTGEKTIQFSQCHGTHEITAMAFDSSGRRLITGGRDGSLKIWNFNNGACLSVLESHLDTEVTSICFLKQKIVVGGWSGRLAVYRDTREPDDVIPKYYGEGVHREDILCMAYQEPNILASASYDGDVVVWNVDVERNVCRLNASDEDSRRGKHPRLYHQLGLQRGQRKALQSCVGKGSHVTQGEKQESGTASCLRNKDERAIEKIAFLKTRNQDLDSANLVACGSGGWVHFWNIYGGGLVGEFTIWESGRPSCRPDEKSQRLESVTALRVDSSDASMFTGSSLGYLQIWDIRGYCKGAAVKPVRSLPPLLVTWRAHLSSVVSIDLAETKGLLVTASSDCCVCLWTTQGRYIGTFGERSPWRLTYPLKPTQLPRKTPPGISRAASFMTTQIVSGPYASKWKLARNLFLVLQRATKYRRPSSDTKETPQHSEHSDSPSSDSILGKCYKRRTRFQQPLVSCRVRQTDGRLSGVYSALRCSEIQEPDKCTLPSLTDCKPLVACTHTSSVGSKTAGGWSRDHLPPPRFEHTEASLLPMVNQTRRVTTLKV